MCRYNNRKIREVNGLPRKFRNLVVGLSGLLQFGLLLLQSWTKLKEYLREILGKINGMETRIVEWAC
jgi:hypothetical protein